MNNFPSSRRRFLQTAAASAGARATSEAQELLLVMTSANPGGEPLVTGNDEAVARLQGIADALLLHDRDIVARCDDTAISSLLLSFGLTMRRVAKVSGRAEVDTA